MISTSHSTGKILTLVATTLIGFGGFASQANAGDTALLTCGEIGKSYPVGLSSINMLLALGDTVSYVPNGRPGDSPRATFTATKNSQFFPLVAQPGTTVSCLSAALLKERPGINIPGGSGFSANNQNRAITTGIGKNARQRLDGGSGGGGVEASQDRVFMSTQNAGKSRLQTPEWNAWISTEGRKYNGSLSGYSGNIVAGADKLISDSFLAGLLASIDHTDLTDATGNAKVRSVALGAYFARKIGQNLYLDGHLSLSNPDNKTGEAAFTSKRAMLSFSLAGLHRAGTYKIRPFARLSAYTEQQPSYVGGGGPVAANFVRSQTASIGARFEPVSTIGNTRLTPYFSAALDYGVLATTVAGTSSYTYPRLGMGVSGPVGLGYVTVDLDGGKFNATTFDFGLRATYEFKF